MTTEWDGTERRKMDRDWIERDRLLSETHSDVRHLVMWSKEHTDDDNKRFKLMADRILWIEKTVYTAVGAVSLLMIVLKLIPSWYRIK